MVAEALGRLGTVDVCVLNRWRSPELEFDWPEWVGDAEWCPVGTPAGRDARAMLGCGSPITDRILPDAVEASRARFFSRDYDLTWCAEPRGYEPVAELLSSPIVLDLHNVVSASVAHKRRLLFRRPWLAGSWRQAIDDPVYRPGFERRWQAWEDRAARDCDRVVVCSDIDRKRIGGGAASVVPNCYRRPLRPAGTERQAGGVLRIGFVGFLDYQPNFDAVRWFAEAILPRVRRLEADAEFVVIGQAGPGLRSVERRPGVRLLGFVPDLGPELAKLSVLVAPIRFGGGTRFKILEAFAHQIPVVSTTIGVEGIDARDEHHLLVRDDPADFARAVVAVHRSAPLRVRLVGAAAQLYDQRYTWERGLAAVEQVVEDLTAADDRSGERIAAVDVG